MAHSEKPYGALIDNKKKKPPHDPYAAELDHDAAEIERARKKVEVQELGRADKVAKKVGSYYITNASFSFLRTQDGFTMSVGQYYPEIKVALDKFYLWNEREIKEAALKEKLFKDSGIEYIYLNPNVESDRKLEELANRIK